MPGRRDHTAPMVSSSLRGSEPRGETILAWLVGSRRRRLLDRPVHQAEPALLWRLVVALRRGRAGTVLQQPWAGRPLEDRVLLVVEYWRTNLTLSQQAPLFGVWKSAADRIIGHLGPHLALQPRKRFRKDTVLIVDGTPVPPRNHAVAKRSGNYRYSTNHQVLIDADIRLVVMARRGLPEKRNDCQAWDKSGTKAVVGNTIICPLTPPRVRPDRTPGLERRNHRSHKQVRARVGTPLTWSVPPGQLPSSPPSSSRASRVSWCSSPRTRARSATTSRSRATAGSTSPSSAKARARPNLVVMTSGCSGLA